MSFIFQMYRSLMENKKLVRLIWYIVSVKSSLRPRVGHGVLAVDDRNSSA